MSRLMEISTSSFSGSGRACTDTVWRKMNTPSEAMLFLMGVGSGFSGLATDETKTLHSLRLYCQSLVKTFSVVLPLILYILHLCRRFDQ